MCQYKNYVISNDSERTSAPRRSAVEMSAVEVFSLSLEMTTGRRRANHAS